MIALVSTAGGDFDRDGPATGADSGGGVDEDVAAGGAGAGAGVVDGVRAELGSGVGVGTSAEGAAAAPPLFSRYVCTKAVSADSEYACKLATMRSVTRAAERVVKSNDARNDAEGIVAPSSNFARFVSGGSGIGVAEGGLFREASDAAFARRCFSSAAAFSIRDAWADNAACI